MDSRPVAAADVLVSLRELAVTRATNAGHPALADTVFHLRALRALGIVLVEELKERLRQSSANANVLDRLALLSDPEAEVVRPSQDRQMPVPNGIHKKRKKQVQDGWDGEGAPSTKRRKPREE
ncbi:uncharacterized protein LOC8066394 isoform X2 [Sorghum bicolor]|uniref:uncharacterized protein LOC8066394 isoform X2 n=1 Tax=Sorghum bicolor TaxID=4558 RepID=UPI000B425D3B|nr:uncharacterized protein LOC8066394 isoform X2 [Sorghum bicolor]|eukprot:XP_021305828.1 uncharacterized protein LOC8066394 isoform X2 [Sorghum bicolor]